MNKIKTFIDKVLSGQDLTEEETINAFQIIMTGGATPAQISAFLVGLKLKGESVSEITGAAIVMRSKSLKLNIPEGALDTCGTGGDGVGSYNISTAVAFVVSACGVPVAKHGNKAVSSKSGSADVLSELGVDVMAKEEVMEEAFSQAGICFMMAPKFHSAMRFVAPVRQELGVRTIFNILGPLSNPANAKYQLLGVYSKKLVEPVAHVLNKLGIEKAWVVHGADGMDELTTTSASYVAQLENGEVSTFEVNPEDVGIKIASPDDLVGGDVNANAQHLKHLLRGKGDKYYEDIVVLNSAAALVVANKAIDLNEGAHMARQAIESGKANEVLCNLVAISNQVMNNAQ